MRALLCARSCNLNDNFRARGAMIDAVRIVVAVRERLTELKITNRNERDTSEMRAPS